MATAPKYDPMSFAQITGGMQIPSWVFSEPAKTVSDYEQQANQLAYQEGQIQQQQMQQELNQRKMKANEELAPIFQSELPFDQQLEQAQRVIAKYDPGEAFKLSMDQRREQRQEERDKVSMFSQLMRDNPMIAQQWAEQNGMSDKLGVGGMDLSSMGGQIVNRSDGVYRIFPDGRSSRIISDLDGGRGGPKENMDYLYDPKAGHDVFLNVNDPVVREGINSGKYLRSAPKPEDPFEAMIRNAMAGQVGGQSVMPKTETTSVDTKVQTAASGYAEGATATNHETGERRQFIGGQWVPIK